MDCKFLDYPFEFDNFVSSIKSFVRFYEFDNFVSSIKSFVRFYFAFYFSWTVSF